MEINRANLRTLGIGFKSTFQNALQASATSWGTIATEVDAQTETQEYGWLGSLPRIREWIGDRQVNNLRNYSFQITEKPWESTLEVNRRHIETDNLGIYAPRVQLLGQAAGSHYDELVWPLLGLGFSTACYDGQFFFDTDHPVFDKNGVAQSVANTDGGSGTAWYLVADDFPIKPIILQKGKPFEFVSKDAPNDDNVFWQNKFLYGVSAFHNAGFGMWQANWGSKQTLDVTHFNAAMAALMGMKGDFERPFNFKKFRLVVPPSLRAAGLQIVNAQYNADGSSNVNYQTAALQVEAWLG